MRRVVLLVWLVAVLGCAHGGPQPGPVAPPAEQAEEQETTQRGKELGSKAAWFVFEVVETILWNQ